MTKLADLTPEELHLVKSLQSEMMTDEESDKDENDTTVRYIRRSVPWRTDQVNQLIARLDGVESSGSGGISKPRIIGPPSARRPSARLDKAFIAEEFLDTENNT